ncbi:PLC-like phosphodiesterase [Phascolomyces articulosus]|uniref:PLC-like phosphodiesterase n=1 Tax=Phascolomyces articulosus TaxID=60185 RepID=A0AAD5JR40_9FUNG|nr:PLC-like phosphodiesterase [Phascolomyces articulosus]
MLSFFNVPKYSVFLFIFINLLSFIHPIQATLCNGHESLCSRRYNEVTYLITHDSYAHGNNIAATQNEPIIQQLNKGVRGLKFSAKKDPSNLHLCHTSCTILDAGSAIDNLNKISAWLKENPGEIVTIFWNNLYNYDINYLTAAYETSTVVPYIYTHEQQDHPWPTLQEMIDSGKRLVNFVDVGADTSKTPWLMDEFSFVFETPYDNTNPDEFKCTIDRPKDLQNSENMMYVVNHFLYGVIEIGMKIEVPQRDKARETNGDSLQKHVDECSEIFQRKPNFIEVDFYEQGQALQYVATFNGVPPPSSVSSTDTTDGEPVVDASKTSPNAFEEIREKGRKISHVIIDNISSSANPIITTNNSSLLSSIVISSLLVIVFLTNNILY